MSLTDQPRRLIEVDLPIREISKQARREKSVRHGHISTMHIWWARRPLASCRAVLLAALLPDPEDERCPSDFFAKAARALDFRFGRRDLTDPSVLQRTLLDFVGEFADWDRSIDRQYVGCARDLVAAAYPNGPPLVVDPFAGGGAIPLEALRLGADVWASDYSGLSALLLRVLIESIPKYGVTLADGLARWGPVVNRRLGEQVGRFYPNDADGSVPVAYLWARTARCEGPGCGAMVPLLRQMSLAKRSSRKIALDPVVDASARRVDFAVVKDQETVSEGTIRDGALTCPVCGFVTPRSGIEKQLAKRRGGTRDAKLIAVASRGKQRGRSYRIATLQDASCAHEAAEALVALQNGVRHIADGVLGTIRPSPAARGVSAVTRYGMTRWEDLFVPRQMLTLNALSSIIRDVSDEIVNDVGDAALARAITSCLGLALGRSADMMSSLTRWVPSGEFIADTFSRQALPMVWDFAEANPLSGSSGALDGAIRWIEKVCRREVAACLPVGQTAKADARMLPLADEQAQCVFTDPPYYDQIPYADLSEYFLQWLSPALSHLYPELIASPQADQDGELVVHAGRKEHGRIKDRAFFQTEMRRALEELRRVLVDDGIAVIVFAHKETAGWEALVAALIDAGWTVTGSWPIETERAARVRARGAASLQSSVHIVCRARAADAGVGDWRQVRAELERNIAEWLPRLAKEGIEGADAIFACLGPALRAYSRYDRVETASGATIPIVPLREAPNLPALLPTVWAAVAREAMRMIFAGPQAEAFEEDARLTALWLWTLRAVLQKSANGADPDHDVDGNGANGRSRKDFTLDYDTARKLAQALGVHLEALAKPGGMIEIKAGEVRLAMVSERKSALLGEASPGSSDAALLFPDIVDETSLMSRAVTTLEQVQQAMLLFSEGRTDDLRRLIELRRLGGDTRVRRLAQALSSLYPSGSREKRWVDGLLALLRQLSP